MSILARMLFVTYSSSSALSCNEISCGSIRRRHAVLSYPAYTAALLISGATDSRSARQRTCHRQGPYRRREEGPGAYCSAAAEVPTVAHDKDGPATREPGAAGMCSFPRWLVYGKLRNTSWWFRYHLSSFPLWRCLCCMASSRATKY